MRTEEEFLGEEWNYKVLMNTVSFLGESRRYPIWKTWRTIQPALFTKLKSEVIEQSSPHSGMRARAQVWLRVWGREGARSVNA